jgi:hypothetical protein
MFHVVDVLHVGCITSLFYLSDTTTPPNFFTKTPLEPGRCKVESELRNVHHIHTNTEALSIFPRSFHAWLSIPFNRVNLLSTTIARPMYQRLPSAGMVFVALQWSSTDEVAPRPDFARDALLLGELLTHALREEDSSLSDD